MALHLMSRRAAASSKPCSVGRPAARSVVRRASDGKSVEELLASASDLLDRVEQGKSIDVTGTIEELEGMGYVCDESGCVLVPLDKAIEEADGTGLARLLHGSNWKLGMDAAGALNSEYPAVVAGPHWTIPMTAAELGTFIEVLQRIRATVHSLKSEGQWTPGAGERPLSRVKWDCGRIFMQATYATANSMPAFTLDFTLQTPHGRPVQACWPVEVVAAVGDALDMELGPLPSLERATANTLA